MRPFRTTAILSALSVTLLGCYSSERKQENSSTERLSSDSSHPHSTFAESLTIVSSTQDEQRRRTNAHALDPRQDGWDTEVLAERAKSALLEILQPLNVSDPSHEFVSVHPTFRCEPLRPPLREVFRDSSIVVLRAKTQAGAVNLHDGPRGLSEALAKLAEPILEGSEIRVQLKVVQVSAFPDTVETTVKVERDAQTDSAIVEQHAKWNCRWLLVEDASLQLKSIKVVDYEEVASTNPNKAWFSECTEAVLEKNASFREQLVYGLNHWLVRIGREKGIHVFARCGLAIGDCNGDGLDDLYVCQPGGLPNRLFLQSTDGTAMDVSATAGVDWLDHSSSSLFVDLDNDGDQELVVATLSGLLVMENDGAGHFRRRATLPPMDLDVQSISAADYDSDGDLDLYVCIDFANRQSLRGEESSSFVYHDANDGGANVLFRNDIGQGTEEKWQFADVTRESGLDVNNRRHSLAAAWEDFDNDGDQDLYVANDYGQNCLYRNDRGQFTDVAEASNVVDFGSGMSVSWADFNHDGWMDLYVGNMFSSAGNRITRQLQFKSGTDEKVRSIYTRFAKGNSLFQNLGAADLDTDIEFREVGAMMAVETGRWAWSSVFADLNNDGNEDLVVANGYITTDDTGDL